MSKDVCPYCERADPELTTITLSVQQVIVECECYSCPTCSEKFMTIDQVERLLVKFFSEVVSRATEVIS